MNTMHISKPATLSQSERKNSVHRSVPSCFGPGDEKSREGLFATRGRVGGDCSAFDLWGLAAPCYAIFRHKGGMDPAPLLAFKMGFEPHDRPHRSHSRLPTPRYTRRGILLARRCQPSKKRYLIVFACSQIIRHLVAMRPRTHNLEGHRAQSHNRSQKKKLRTPDRVT